MANQPLAEVFGFPPNDLSDRAERYRRNKLCPYNNKVPSCTKDKAKDPLGVCSIYDGDQVAITCPVRFRQDWLIIEDAASFLFDSGTTWTTLQEIRLNDAEGKSAGNIDFVFVAYDEDEQTTDFGSLEVQAMSEPLSSPQRLAPEIIRKGLTLQKLWQKKQAVALHRAFYEFLPNLPETDKEEADIAWLLYDLQFIPEENRYQLTHHQTVYTEFGSHLF